MRDAAKAKAALQDMGDAAKAETAAEVAGSSAAAAARAKDIAAIQAETQALNQLGNAAKQTNVQLLYGGRADEAQHLADLAQELNYTTLLNRQRWLGFSSVQQAMSYRQQMYQLALLENKAHFAGYLTADQYLSFLQRETMQTAALSASIRDRTFAITGETQALLAHTNALQGTHQTVGALGEQLASTAVFAAALSGIPASVHTRVFLDDSQALAEIAAYRAALLGLPHAESTDIISVATRLGGVPLTGRPLPVSVTPVLNEAAAARELSTELKALNAVPVRPEVDSSSIEAALDDAYHLDGVLIGLTFERVTPQVDDSEITQAVADAQALDEMLRMFGREKVHAEIDMAPFFAAEAEAQALAEEMERLNAMDTVIHVNADGAIEDIQTLEGKIVSAEEAGKALMNVLGQGGKAGGGGGGGPPKPPAPPGAAPGEPNPDDAAAWNMLADAMERAGVQARAAKAASADAGAAATAAGGAARGAGGWWGFWTKDLVLFGGVFKNIPFAATISVWALALHVLIDFFIVLVPAVLAAAAALGAFALAAEPATKDIIAHLTGVHTALDALGTGADNLGTAHFGPLQAQAGSLNATMARLPVTIRTMQSAMAPTVITIFGAAINTLTGRAGLLQSVAQKAGTWVEDMVIKIQQAVASHADMLGPLINTATNDMHILGAIGASILKILGLFLQAGQMTHVSELLFEGLAYALSLLQKALNAIGPYALAAGIALFSVVHYGGLLSTLFLDLVTKVQGLVLALVGLLAKLPLVGGAFEALGVQMEAAFAAVPASVILAVAAAILAVGYAIYSAAQASQSAKAYVGGLVSALANVNASQGFAQIQVNLASMNGWLAQSAAASRNFVGNMAQGWRDLFKDASGFGVHIKAFKDLWEAVTGTNQQPGSTALVLKQMTTEQKEWTTTLQTAADTTKRYGTSVQQSFALMDLAGVKVTDTLSTQLTKVNDLVIGWLNMGVAGYNLKNGMNQLGAAVDSVTLASELQNSQIKTLTGDFTSFLTLVTGGQTAFEAYATGINTVGTNAKATGASMGGLNAASLTLRQSWEANLTAGQSLYNNLLLQNAAAGNNAKSNAALAASGRDIVNSLLEQGGATAESVQGAYALAQTMGYTGKATYDALLKWSGGNQALKGTTADLNKQVGLLETGSANLTNDVLNLAGAISTNLNQAIANGLVNMPAITKAVAGFYQYILTHRAEIAKGITPQELSLSRQVANALIAVYGTSPQGLDQAKNEFLATLSQMGIGRKQALALWSKDQPAPIKPTLDTSSLTTKLKIMGQQLGEAYVPAPGYIAQSNANQAKIVAWFTNSLPHAASVAWSAVYNGFFNDVWHPMGTFFNNTVPGWFNAYSKDWLQHAMQGWQAFNGNVVAPMSKFFSSTVPGWFTGYAQSWQQHWVQGWQAFNNNVIAPLSKFFTVTLVGWFTAYASSWSQHWVQGWQAFNNNILNPMSKFFTGTLPGWITGLGPKFSSLWSTVWNGFNNDVLQPMSKFFTSTLPTVMWNSLKGGIDHVISGLNTVIGWINSVTSIVGVHIGSIPSLARGGAVSAVAGSVPGTGDEDGTHIIAMGGEWMLRKPARMALQAAYGPGVMDWLNNADTWLGSGSRGNAASQRPAVNGRFASGGIPVVSNIANWLGSTVGGAASAVWNGISGAASAVAQFGEQAVFNAMWSTAGAPAQKAMEALGTPGDMGAAWLQDVHNGISSYITAQTAKAQAAAAAPAAGGSGGIIATMMKNMAAARGWTGAQWDALYDVEMAEAGFNMTAKNPTSNAYGLAQFINGPSEYAQYGGNSTTAVGQITAMLNYIAQRYGTPLAAWAHEKAYHWYGAGGMLPLAAGGLAPAGPIGAIVPISQAPGTASAYAASAAPIQGTWQTALNNWKKIALWNSRPSGVSSSAWQGYLNARNVIGDRVTTAEGDYTTLFASLTKAPANLSGGVWSAADTDARRWQQALAAAPLAAKYQPSAYDAVWSQLGTLQDEIINTANIWENAYNAAGLAGAGGGSGTGSGTGTGGTGTGTGTGTGSGPGTGTVPPVPVPGAGNPIPTGVHSAPGPVGGTGPTVIDLAPLIIGGPAHPGTGGFGFNIASGGNVPGNVAAMFSGGMAAGGVVPNLFVPGLSANLSRQLTAATSGQLPRTLSDAAGNRVGLQVDQLTINNPVAERPSESITRASNRLAFLGGRQMI